MFPILSLPTDVVIHTIGFVEIQSHELTTLSPPDFRWLSCFGRHKEEPCRFVYLFPSVVLNLSEVKTGVPSYGVTRSDILLFAQNAKYVRFILGSQNAKCAADRMLDYWVFSQKGQSKQRVNIEVQEDDGFKFLTGEKSTMLDELVQQMIVPSSQIRSKPINELNLLLIRLRDRAVKQIVSSANVRHLVLNYDHISPSIMDCFTASTVSSIKQLTLIVSPSLREDALDLQSIWSSSSIESLSILSGVRNEYILKQLRFTCQNVDPLAESTHLTTLNMPLVDLNRSMCSVLLRNQSIRTLCIGVNLESSSLSGCRWKRNHQAICSMEKHPIREFILNYERIRSLTLFFNILLEVDVYYIIQLISNRQKPKPVDSFNHITIVALEYQYKDRISEYRQRAMRVRADCNSMVEFRTYHSQ